MQGLTTINTPLTMSSREIAELTGKEHKHVLRDIRTMLLNLGDGPEMDHVSEEKDGRGYTAAFHLNKDLTLTLITGYDARLRLGIIQRWQELEKEKVVPTVALLPASVEAMQFAEATANMLKLEGSARLGLARSVTQLVAPHLLAALPSYAVDVPSDSVTSSSEPTASLTTLLREKSIPISTIKANKALESLGFIREMSRISRNHIYKRYWSVTQEGLRYGKNVTSDKNQNETQPHWFISKSDELISLIQSRT